MKKYFYVALLAIGIVGTSCSNQGQNKVNATDSQKQAVVEGQVLTVDPSLSTIRWKGFKPGGSHDGVISIQKGMVTTGANDSVAGSFVIDMNTIVDQDLKDAESRGKLEAHLKGADFFDVQTYPTSEFTITKVEPVINASDSITHIISGNLKMKDVEKNISFAAKVTNDGDTYTAQSVPFTIDRTQWNVQYGSKSVFDNLKDNFINDDIEMQVTIVAKPNK